MCSLDKIFTWKQTILTLIRLLPGGSSLIWVHTVCYIGLKIRTYGYERADNKYSDCMVGKGKKLKTLCLAYKSSEYR